MPDDASNERMVSENLDSTANRRDLLRSKMGIIFRVDVDHPLEILEGGRRETYFRQERGRGRLARFPSTRAVMY